MLEKGMYSTDQERRITEIVSVKCSATLEFLEVGRFLIVLKNKSMADSFQCITKPTTIKQIIIIIKGHVIVLSMQENKVFGDISKEERLFSVRAEGFPWLTISWNKQGLLGFVCLFVCFCTVIRVFTEVVSVMLVFGSFFLSYCCNIICSFRGEICIQNLSSFTDDN